MLTLECLQRTFRSRRFILHSFRSFVGYLAKRIFNLTFFSSTIFWPFSAFHHLAHNLVISFEMLGWLRLRPSGCALCAICQMSNACQRQHVRAISYASFLISAFFHRIVVVVYPGVKCIGQHSALGLALGLGSGPLSSLGVSAILLYLTLSLSLSLCLSLGG